MRRTFKFVLWGVALLLVAGLGFFFFVLPGQVEAALNGVRQPPPYTASQAASELHGAIQIADLHADPLLWGRDLLKRGARGHVDIPRLDEGNVALQVFSVVTKSPQNLNIERNDDRSDDITLLAIGQRWPLRTWFSLKERALYQADRLSRMAAASENRFVLIKTKRDLARFLQRRKAEPGIVAGLLAIEGAHVLEGDPANVDVLFDAGYRMMSVAHFFDTEMGGSAHGVDKGGLTDDGREMIRRMEAKKMIVDLSHGSAAQVADVLAMATRPTVVSHTGVKGTCDNNRNLSDEQLRAIAANGGLVGLGFWETAVCGADAAAIARAQRYTADLIGIDHLALGSDFDGAVETPFDASGLIEVTEAMLAAGFTDEEIGKAMGGNQIRFLLENLPD
ncbi:Zn-dependent dipeptidase, dipeptidase homolog [Mesorhizobium albiziae]|uniref:Zn-dependent dipeptidase, dipeptidase homolog n=1 Tax=Neomesorhizobium albiziae TaxID=335020 RepID=A0A1I4CL04_9HYPH|nr:membrane dipeptidase [Mesorhizobium albiziae]GLS29267.1 dipeptidase [Mesorhizobium albiziae]SFK80766.1 Zn-dependent dipeptidase, dipeptidase homolog [Mesorhizobium albiziae]